MRSAGRSASRSTFGCRAPLALLLVSAAQQISCYKPSIVDGYDGGFKCNLEAGPDHRCPEGFQCDSMVQKCVRQIRDAGTDRNTDGSDAEVEPICFPPRPNCTATPDAGTCDPYCETGCGCVEKCSVNTMGALTCNPPASGQQRKLLEPCQVQMAGTATQIDQCAPGLLCLVDSCGGGDTGRCYQFCRSDMECTYGGPASVAPCNRDVGGGFKVCDVPFDDCSPLAPPNNTGCTGSALGCYIATSDVSKTICDCQVPPGLREGDVCTLSRECNVGLVCVDTNGQGTKQCTRACRLNPNSCLVGTCRMLMQGGVVNTTFGFCG
jgi:hypothetical protein